MSVKVKDGYPVLAIVRVICPKADKVVSGGTCADCPHFGGFITAKVGGKWRVFVDCEVVEKEEGAEKPKIPPAPPKPQSLEIHCGA